MDLDFAALTAVRQTGPQAFEGVCLAGAGERVFGGQVAAQSLRAAASSDGPPPHSIHVHFLAPALAHSPVFYQVTNLKRTPRFVVVRVDSSQDSRVVATSTVAFHVAERSSEHQEAAPKVPAPEDCRELPAGTVGGPSPAFAPVESRLIDVTFPDGATPGGDVPTLRLWQRCRILHCDEVVLHACGLVWMSDLTMTRTVDLPHVMEPGRRMAASLDHTVWFHRPARADEWLLTVQRSTTYTAARGWASAQYFSTGGELVASVAQECLTRRVE